MVKSICVELKARETEDYVAVHKPIVNRGTGDLWNILPVRIEPNENDLYAIAAKEGIQKYTRNEFILCRQQLLTISNVNTEGRVYLGSN